MCRSGICLCGAAYYEKENLCRKYKHPDNYSIFLPMREKNHWSFENCSVFSTERVSQDLTPSFMVSSAMHAIMCTYQSHQ